MSIMLANFGKYAISDCPFILFLSLAKILQDNAFLYVLLYRGAINYGTKSFI